VLRYWCLFFSVAVLFLFVVFDCVCGDNCELGLTLGQNLSVIVKKNNLARELACSPERAPDCSEELQDTAAGRTGDFWLQRQWLAPAEARCHSGNLGPGGNTDTEVSPGRDVCPPTTINFTGHRRGKKRKRGEAPDSLESLPLPNPPPSVCPPGGPLVLPAPRSPS
jgi:hypothetical protein